MAALGNSGPEEVEAALLTETSQAGLLFRGERGLVLASSSGPGAAHSDHSPPTPAGSGVEAVLQLEL